METIYVKRSMDGGKPTYIKVVPELKDDGKHRFRMFNIKNKSIALMAYHMYNVMITVGYFENTRGHLYERILNEEREWALIK